MVILTEWGNSRKGDGFMLVNERKCQNRFPVAEELYRVTPPTSRCESGSRKERESSCDKVSRLSLQVRPH